MDIARLKEKSREIYLLSHTLSLLGWDQETYMPSAAIDERGDQLALLQGLIHDRVSDPALGDALSAINASELNELDRGFIRKLKRDHEHAVRIPRDLVVRFARTVALSQAAWARARPENDFAAFVPYLEQIIDLVIAKAEALGYREHLYDALLDEFEPGMTTGRLEDILVGQVPVLRNLMEELDSRPPIDDSCLYLHYDRHVQEKFSRFILKELGYPMNRGRLDVAAHPFTTSPGIDDVRITTRYNEDFFSSAFFGTIHEAGHAFYELGFGADIRGNILAEGTSLGMHESQSRIWENMIGRSRAFWERYYPHLVQLFPQNLDGLNAGSFYRAINRVSPGFIRVEADEVSYNLHIVLRYQLEKALVTGKVKVGELPEAWNELFSQYFGKVPPTYSEGVLQDIHWSMGSIGYFPTYALGNLWAAQLYTAMDRDIGGVDEAVVSGDFEGIKKWLGEKIHYFGSSRLAGNMIKEITGEELSAEPFLSYVKEKYRSVYDDF